jgi:acetyl-CoA carboxylase, biotin carboxylase subunit
LIIGPPTAKSDSRAGRLIAMHHDPPLKKLHRVLIPNRGEIALRIIRACHQMGIEAVLAMSEADKGSLPAREADRAVCIGPAPAARSYLDVRAIIAAAQGTGCDGVHPGYGFLSEKPELAEACQAAGLIFIGPLAGQIEAMGNKLHAREQAKRVGLPMLPGSEQVGTWEEAARVADGIGYPVLLKAAAGGGGRGMKIVGAPSDIQRMFEAAASEARAAFNDDTLYLERYIAQARHVEVQVLGDSHGNMVHLGERDCSLQRRHQKLVEESPAPGIDIALRHEICAAAVSLARSIGYENAGTVEFLYDECEKRYYFLEMNTRIQVEHPVSETVTGIDLVQEQLRIARGERLRFDQAGVIFRGHAIECRINAEVPEQGFRPSPGRITTWKPPQGTNIRLDSHCHPDYLVPPYYDSMIGKLIVYGRDRSEALGRMQQALAIFEVSGIETTLGFLQRVMAHEDFVAGRVSTMLVERMLEEIKDKERIAS